MTETDKLNRLIRLVQSVKLLYQTGMVPPDVQAASRDALEAVLGREPTDQEALTLLLLGVIQNPCV